MKKWMMLSVVVVCLAGCELIDYHPYDTRIKGANTDVNRKNIERIEASCRGKKSIRFAFMGDSQRWFDETFDFVAHINQRDDVDFVIHGGDLADYGLKKEFILMEEIMSRLDVPYVAILGNHDIIGNGDAVYAKIFGDDNFSFVAGEVKFLCLNTNAIEYDYSKPVPDFVFIENEIDKQQNVKRTIPVMHAPPECEQFNNNVSRVFQRYLKEFPGYEFALHAHNHTLSETDIFNDGIIYYGTTCMEDRKYMLFTINEDDYSYEVVEY